MQIDKSYQIYRACAQDSRRPTLECVLVTRFDELLEMIGAPDDTKVVFKLNKPEDINGVAVATDGFMLAIVPVQIDNEDVTGLIHKDTFKQALKGSKSGFARLSLQEKFVELPNGNLIKRDFIGTYPMFLGVLTEERDEVVKVEPYPASIHLDVKLLFTLAQAIGIHGSRYSGAHISIYPSASSGNQPIYITTAKKASGRWMPPFGIIMPVHSR